MNTSRYWDSIQEMALSIGWERHDLKVRAQKQDLKKELVLMQEQCGLYLEFLNLWPLNTPRWALEELSFPLTKKWIHSIEGRIDFDLRWRLEWDEQKKRLPPETHQELPALPELIQPGDVAGLLQVRKDIQSRFWVKIWFFVRWFFPSFYRWKNKWI